MRPKEERKTRKTLTNAGGIAPCRCTLFPLGQYRPVKAGWTVSKSTDLSEALIGQGYSLKIIVKTVEVHLLALPAQILMITAFGAAEYALEATFVPLTKTLRVFGEGLALHVQWNNELPTCYWWENAAYQLSWHSLVADVPKVLRH